MIIQWLKNGELHTFSANLEATFPEYNLERRENLVSEVRYERLRNSDKILEYLIIAQVRSNDL